MNMTIAGRKNYFIRSSRILDWGNYLIIFYSNSRHSRFRHPSWRLISEHEVLWRATLIDTCHVENNFKQSFISVRNMPLGHSNTLHFMFVLAKSNWCICSFQIMTCHQSSILIKSFNVFIKHMQLQCQKFVFSGFICCK